MQIESFRRNWASLGILLLVLVVIALLMQIRSQLDRKSVSTIKCSGSELDVPKETLLKRLEEKSCFVTKSGLLIFDGRGASYVRFGFRENLCKYIGGPSLEITSSERTIKFDGDTSPSDIRAILGEPDAEMPLGTEVLQLYDFQHLDMRIEVLLISKVRYKVFDLPVGRKWLVGSYNLFHLSSSDTDGFSNRYILKESVRP